MHHNYEDSDSAYELDAENKGKSFGVGGYRGRIIFLGDGTEVLTDSDDTEMFDNADEDKDLESQVSKPSSSNISKSEATSTTSDSTKDTDTKPNENKEGQDVKKQGEAASAGDKKA